MPTIAFAPIHAASQHGTGQVDPLDIGLIDPTSAVAANVIPGAIPYLGSWGCWNNKAKLQKEEVFYGRMFVPAGTYDRMTYGCKKEDGTTIEFAIYLDDGLATPSPTGGKIVSVADFTPTENAIEVKSFDGDLVIATPGYRWFALRNSGTKDVEVYSTSHKYEKAWRDWIFAEDKQAAALGTAPVPANLDAPKETPLPFFALLFKP